MFALPILPPSMERLISGDKDEAHKQRWREVLNEAIGPKAAADFTRLPVRRKSSCHASALHSLAQARAYKGYE
jgi:hypothetical protein